MTICNFTILGYLAMRGGDTDPWTTLRGSHFEKFGGGEWCNVEKRGNVDNSLVVSLIGRNSGERGGLGRKRCERCDRGSHLGDESLNIMRCGQQSGRDSHLEKRSMVWGTGGVVNMFSMSLWGRVNTIVRAWVSFWGREE